MKLFHATSQRNYESIVSDGFLSPSSFWAVNEEVHQYYLETISDEGENPVSISIDISELDEAYLLPDMQGLEEPLSFTLKKSEEQIWDEWSKSEGSWRDSIEIIGSLMYSSAIPIEKCEVILFSSPSP